MRHLHPGERLTGLAWMSGGQELGEGPKGSHLPQKGEKPRVRGQVAVYGYGQERWTQQVHWPLGGEFQHRDVLSWCGSSREARGAGTEQSQEEQQRQRQPGLPAQQHLGLTWLPPPVSSSAATSETWRTSSQPATAAFSPSPPAHASSPLPLRPASLPLLPASLPLLPASLPLLPLRPAPPPRSFLLPRTLSTYEITHIHLKGADVMGIQAPGRSPRHPRAGFLKHSAQRTSVRPPAVPASGSQPVAPGLLIEMKTSSEHSSLTPSIWLLNCPLSLPKPDVASGQSAVSKGSSFCLKKIESGHLDRDHSQKCLYQFLMKTVCSKASKYWVSDISNQGPKAFIHVWGL